jgi:PhnB protein
MITATSIGSDEARIGSTIDDWARAIREKDADRLMLRCTPDFVQFSLAPPLQYVAETARDQKNLKEWFATWEGPISYEIHDLRIRAGENVAFSYSLNRMSGTRADGETSNLWFRVTLCFEKTDDEWKIAHEHDSVPFYMDGSARAAIDLEP